VQPQSNPDKTKKAIPVYKRRHRWSVAFSPRRLADADCFDVRIPKERAGKRTSGDVERDPARRKDG